MGFYQCDQKKEAHFYSELNTGSLNSIAPAGVSVRGSLLHFLR